MQRPGIGIVFQCALAVPVQVHQAGFQQAQQRRGGQTAAQQIQRSDWDRTGRAAFSGVVGSSQNNGIFCSGIHTGSAAGTGRPCGKSPPFCYTAHPHGHALRRSPRGLSLRLAAVRLIIGNSRGGGVHLSPAYRSDPPARCEAPPAQGHLCGAYPGVRRISLQGTPALAAMDFKVSATRRAPLNTPSSAWSGAWSQHRLTVTSATGSMAASMARLEWLNVSNSSMYTVRPAKGGLVQAFWPPAPRGRRGPWPFGPAGFHRFQNQGQFPQLIFVRTGALA